jgi:hypothetical protein
MFGPYQTWWPYSFYGGYGTFLGDVDGDFRADLVGLGGGYIGEVSSTGKSFGAYQTWWWDSFYGVSGATPSASGPAPQGTLFGDVNGDRLADLVAVQNGTIGVLLSTGSSFGVYQQWASDPFYGSQGTLLGDMNGDGLADLVALGDNYVDVRLSNGTTFEPTQRWWTWGFYGSHGTLIGDVNGDGYADLVGLGDGYIGVLASTGAGFYPYATALYGSFYGSHGTLIGDVNADGYADLVALNDSSVTVSLSAVQSTASGPYQNFGPAQTWWAGPFYGGYGNFLGDVSGDGYLDLVGLGNGYIGVLTGMPCGWVGMPVCADGSCKTGTPANGTCACGGAGQVPCGTNSCQAGLIVQGGFCEPPPKNDLKFYNMSDQLIEEFITPTGQDFAWSPTDLTNVLATQPVSQTGVVFYPGNSTSEADVFVRDPSDIIGEIHLYAPGNDTNFVVPNAVPPALVPSLLHTAPGLDITWLTQATFFGNTTPFGVATDANGHVRVQAARIYDHGPCSTEIGFEVAKPVQSGAMPVQPIFPQIDTALWMQIAQKTSTAEFGGKVCNDDLATMFLNTQNIRAYLDHTPGDPTSGSGGFFVTLTDVLDLHNSLPNDSIWFVKQYEFGLSSASDPNGPGILTIGPVWHWDEVIGFNADSVASDFTDALNNTFPTQFEQFTLAQQTADGRTFLPGSTSACNPAAAQQPDCQSAENILEAGIALGANNLPAGTLSSSDVTALKAAAGAKDASGALVNWTCVPDSSTAGGHCAYRVRAKRINVYPDEVELVWFDGAEPNNSTYALWVAGHATTSASTAINQLCSAPPPQGGLVRNFAVDNVAPSDSTQVPCPKGIPVGTPMLGGCFCFDGHPCVGPDGKAGTCPVNATPDLGECLSSNGCDLTPGECPVTPTCGAGVPSL